MKNGEDLNWDLLCSDTWSYLLNDDGEPLQPLLLPQMPVIEPPQQASPTHALVETPRTPPTPTVVKSEPLKSSEPLKQGPSWTSIPGTDHLILPGATQMRGKHSHSVKKGDGEPSYTELGLLYSFRGKKVRGGHIFIDETSQLVKKYKQSKD